MGKRCFVVMGYGIRYDLSSKKKINLDAIYSDIIKPAVISCDYECIRGDEVLDSGLIDESMYYGILESDLVVADITTLNSNAIYELGVRHGVRRFRTIIMMESGDKFFFDLNHNRTLTYTYCKNKKKYSEEVESVKDKLIKIIQEIDKHEQIDSPLYKFVPDLNEPQRQNKESIVNKGIEPLYKRIKEATDLRRIEHFEEAYSLYKKLSDEIPSDPYFKQQMALCAYKSKKPSETESLDLAESILKPISEAIDPETNGLLGAIFKRKFFITGIRDYLEEAIKYYKQSYNLFADYYTGENYAFCLLLKASKEEELEVKEELGAIAKHIYREVYNSFKSYNEYEVNTEYEIWQIASLASCTLALGKEEESKEYENSFLKKADQMMQSSYSEQKEKLVELLKLNNYGKNL